MKAITIIESDDGSLTGSGSGLSEDVDAGVELLHRGIEALVTMRFKNVDGDA